MNLANSLSRLRTRVATLAQSHGRRVDDVRLVAVTKHLDTPTTIALVRAGQAEIAENRIEALAEKKAALAAVGLYPRWHMVGHLQSRKAAQLVEHQPEFHALDSLRLLQALSKRIADGDKLRCYAQVNISGETTKHGLKPEELELVLEQASGSNRVEIIGLMTMAPLTATRIFPDATDRIELARLTFSALAKLRLRYVERFPNLQELSMGMSDDFEVAIACGSTLIRIGRALTNVTLPGSV